MKKENIQTIQNFSFSDIGGGQFYYDLDGLYTKNLTKKEIGYTTNSSISANPTYVTVNYNSGSVSTNVTNNTVYIWIRLTYSDLGVVTICYDKYGDRYSIYLSGGGQACFKGDTKVLTVKGLVEIKDLKINDVIVTENGKQPICRKYEHLIDEVYKIYIENETIECSYSHPFITQKGKVCAKELVIGDTVQTIEGKMLQISNIEIENKPMPVYEINTVNANEYYITDSKILVGSEELVGVKM